MSGVDEGLRAVLASELRAAGLTDDPVKYDGAIHSWRCEYPGTYGQCSCFGDLVEDLANAIAAHLGEVVGGLRDDVAIKLDTREECEHERDVDSWGYECPTCAADAVLAVVSEALTGHPARSGGAVGAAGGEVALGDAGEVCGPQVGCRHIWDRQTMPSYYLCPRCGETRHPTERR